MVGQSICRDEGKRAHTKHLIRFRHEREMARKDSDEAFEILMLNSHDGTSSYQMLSGFFRFVCLNGIVRGDVTDDIRIRHKGNVIDDVKQAAAVVLDGTDLVREVRDDMKRIELSRDEQHVLAEAALTLRFENTAPVTADQMLRPRRMADTGSSLWSSFNVLQENSIKGGLHGRTANNKRMTTRAVTGLEQDRKLNQALWHLAEGMRRIKNGGH